MSDLTPKRAIGGRPAKITPSILEKLRQAFCWDWSDAKSCYYAGISTETLYAYQRTNPDFVKEKKVLRSSAAEMAKRNIHNALKSGDIKVSQWYLERRDEQFSVKKQLDVNVSQVVNEADVAASLLKLIEKIESRRADIDIPQAVVEQSTMILDS